MKLWPLACVVLSTQLLVYPNYSSNHGIEGVINTPTAYITEEGSLKLNFYRGEPDRKLLLTASPFKWMQASLFYVDVTNRPYGGNFKQSYKDKGFNLKINLIEESTLPSLSLGLNDFAGTGVYNSEYIVLSKTSQKISYSLGLGWGDLSSGPTVNNPLIFFDEAFKSRGNLIKDLGGTPNPNVYFRGRHASFFGNLIFRHSNKLSYLLEIDPTVSNKPNIIPYSKKKSDMSFGAYYKFNKNVHAKISYERGAEATFSLIFKRNYKNLGNQPQYISVPRIEENNTYSHLQRILELNNIGLVNVKEGDSSIKLEIKQNSYNDINLSNKYTILAIKDSGVSDPNKDIEIIQSFLGMNVYESIIDGQSQREIVKDSRTKNKEELDLKYLVTEKYPIFNSTLGIAPRLFIASREGFLYQGLFLNHASEIAFSEELIFSSNLRYSLSDNFNGLYIAPVDTYPEVVRSDVKKYLNQLDNGITIGRLQFDYYNQVENNFFQLTFGLLEDMFAGAIFEYLYFPQDSILGIGFESNYVKKRDYKGRFGLKKYNNKFSRIKFVLREPKNKIITTFSYGEYIAGDVGYTLQFDKRFNNGVKFGVFFSKTDVPPQLYGEGSFDKGIKLAIPFGFGQNNISNWEWRPLTKDPAALIIRKNNLAELLERYRN